MISIDHAVVMQRMGQPITQSVGTVIYGWGQYKDQVSLLPKAERDKIDQLADLIVSSFAQYTFPPFRKVAIVGHADKDWHGPRKEEEVAFNRASAIEDALTGTVKDLWDDRGMGAQPLGGVEWVTDGKGATQMTAKPYHAQNRCVEVLIIRTGPLIPRSPCDQEDLETRVARLLKLLDTRRVTGDSTGGQTKRMKCILPKLLKPGVIDIFVDGSIANQTINGWTPKGYDCIKFGRNAGWKGNYDGTKHPMPPEELKKFLTTLTPIIMNSGFTSCQSDDHVLVLLGTLSQNMDDGINMVDEYLTQSAMMSDTWAKELFHKDGYAGDVARKKLQSLYRRNLNDPNNIYSCFA
jgi:hypothetical protein